MNATATPGELRTRRHEANGCPSSRPAAEARVRFRKTARSPRFKASGSDAVFFHFRIPAAVLQPHVGYPLDLMDGHEVVSWVAFRRENFHCPALSFLGKWPWRPFADERFLNVRPHVRHRGESGILFLAELLSNPPLRRPGPWALRPSPSAATGGAVSGSGTNPGPWQAPTRPTATPNSSSSPCLDEPGPNRSVPTARPAPPTCG